MGVEISEVRESNCCFDKCTAVNAGSTRVENASKSGIEHSILRKKDRLPLKEWSGVQISIL